MLLVQNHSSSTLGYRKHSRLVGTRVLEVEHTISLEKPNPSSGDLSSNPFENGGMPALL